MNLKHFFPMLAAASFAMAGCGGPTSKSGIDLANLDQTVKPGESFYDFSMTCLENAESILKTLEEEYQKVFERKLTLKRLGEVITYPKNPDMFAHVKLDESMAPSAFVEMDIEKLIRMRKMFR